jgi:hypothetical protein
MSDFALFRNTHETDHMISSTQTSSPPEILPLTVDTWGFNGQDLALKSVGEESKSMSVSDDTICDVEFNCNTKDSTLTMFQSRNPFLEMILGPNVKTRNTFIRNEKTNHNFTMHSVITEANNPASKDCEEDFSCLSIRERMKRLKQLGVQ